MQKVTIDRAKWLHSEGSEESYLFRPRDEKMCCLGFACQQLAGLDEAKMSYIPAPSSFSAYDNRSRLSTEEWDKVQEVFRMKGTESGNSIVRELIMVNDDFEIYRTSDEKEKTIKEFFRDLDIEVEFTGEYPEALSVEARIRLFYREIP